MADSSNGTASGGAPARSDSVDEYNVFDDAKTYYSDSRHKVNKATARTRTFSQVRYTRSAPYQWLRRDGLLLTRRTV